MVDRNIILIARTMNEEKISANVPTKYIFHWAELVKKEAKLLGLKVIDLKNENFTEENMKKMIEEFDPYIIFLNGHGTEYSIKGKDDKTDVIIRCKNDHLFKDRIVYALSCKTSRILGKSAYNKGCKCYIGYKEELIFPTQQFENVLDDFVSEPFMKVSNEIVITLIKTGSPHEAIQNFHKLSDELINYWKKQTKPESLFIQKYLKLMKKIIYAPIPLE